MKVQVMIPPYVVRNGKAVLPNKAMLPVGPLIIATLLQRMGCEVKVVDLVFYEQWQKHIIRLKISGIMVWLLSIILISHPPSDAIRM